MKNDPPGGCFGKRVDQLIRACKWNRKQACKAFGFSGSAYGWMLGGDPVERVRIGGHAAPAFVKRLRALEAEYSLELQRLEAVEKHEEKRWREIDRQLAERAIRRQAAVENASGILTEIRDGLPALGISVVVHVSSQGRVVSRESVESWVARHAAAGKREEIDAGSAERKG